MHRSIIAGFLPTSFRQLTRSRMTSCGGSARRILLGTAAAVAFTNIASAADLPVAAPIYKAPPIARGTTWDGFYVGAHVGYGWDPATASFNPSSYVAAIMAPFGGWVDTGPDSGPVNLAVHPKGWLGGAQLGYNWQQSALVYGLETDFTWSGMKDSRSAPWFVNGTVGGDQAGLTGNVGLQQKLDYFGTARGRLGWTDGPALLYGTGGLAWAHATTTFGTFGITQSANLGFSPAQLAALQSAGDASTSSVRLGFAVGGGVEWMIAHNWSLRAEYLFIGLGGGSTLTIPGGVAHSTLTDVQVARVGVNYFFHQ
jgi:outer membrane immunogenic protein